MIRKWQKNYESNEEVKKFIDYFMKWWLSPKRCGWFDHYADFIPITNNALESTNRYVKDNGN
jgi:hypothetical protein